MIGNPGSQSLVELCLVDYNVDASNGNSECVDDCTLGDNEVVSPGSNVSCSTTYQVLLLSYRTCPGVHSQR